MAGKTYTWTTGRRKTSIARIRVLPGSGQMTVNRRPIDRYFLTEEHRNAALAPLTSTKTQGKYDFFIMCTGGGVAGQAGAVKLGVARALLKLEPALEPRLREEGFLTRDPRMKERKKFGLRGARRGVQYSKR